MSEILLPIEAQECIDDFVAESDELAFLNLQKLNLTDAERHKFSTLWSMASTCMASVDLCWDMLDSDLEAKVVMNDKAFYQEYDFGFAMFTDRRSHAVVKVNSAKGEVYVDAFWQQFFGDLALNLEDVEQNPDHNLIPAERVLCYTADQVDDLAFWFANTVRMANDRVKSGALMGKVDSLTRELKADRLFLRTDEVRFPVQYRSFEELESIAKQIWHPDNFRTLEVDEINKILKIT